MNIIEYTKELGLTEYQSKVMLVLFKRGESTAKDISEFSAIPLTKIYQVLKELEETGLVNPMETKPKKYATQDADEIFNILIETKKSEIEFLRKTATLFLKEISTIKLTRTAPLKRIHPCLDVQRLY